MKAKNNNIEREISMRELWWYIISKWKSILVIMVVLALTMGAFGVYKSISSNTIQEDVEISMDKLTSNEQEEVLNLLEKNNEYIAKKKEYDNSYLMKLNYNSVYRCMLSYYVDTDYSYNYLDVKDDYTTELVSMYKTYISSDEIRSIIVGLNIEGLTETDLNYMLSATNEGDIIKISICADIKDCEKLATTISNEILKYYETATQIVGEHKITCISTDVVELYNENIKNGQALKTAYIKGLSDEINILKETLTAEQKAVYEAETTEGVEENIQINTSFINKKYIVLGLIGGAVLGIAIAIITFIIGAKVKTVDEISQISGVEIIGKIIKDSTRQKKIAKKLNRIKGEKTEEEQNKYVAQTLINMCKQNNYSNVVFCTSVDGLTNEMNDIISVLKKSEIKCIQAGDVNSDSDTINVISEEKNVVFVEKINKSMKEDVLMALDKCETLSANILGMIVII